MSKVMWGFLYTGAFLVSFVLSAVIKMTFDPFGGKYKAHWDSSVGTVYSDLPYGEGEANRFDLYVPAEKSRESIPFVIEEAEKLGYSIDSMAVSGGSAGHALAMIYAYRDAKTAPVPVKLVFGAVGPSCFYLEDWINMGVDPHHPKPVDPTADYNGVAELFSAMAGKKITTDMLANGTYLDQMKDISAAMWITEGSVPSVYAYGAWDRVQSFFASKRLDDALTHYQVPHESIVCEHSGHGLQNDNAQYKVYLDKVSEYLHTYLPVN